MEYTIKSRKLRRDITFSRPGSYYIYVDLVGQSGTLGSQICEKGRTMSGSCLGISGDGYELETQKRFESVCKAWWRRYLAEYDADCESKRPNFF